MAAGEHGLIELALAQDGVVTREQARGCGVAERTLRRRIADGAWLPQGRRVLTLAGSPATWRQRLRIGLFIGGVAAAVSRYSALSLHGLRAFPDADVDIVVPHPRHVTAGGIRFHQVTDLEGSHVTTARGLRVTRPERALVDCSSVMSVPRLGLVFDEAVTGRLTSVERVADHLAQVARPGKRRLGHIATVLDERGETTGVAQSVLEADVLRLLAGHGIERPVTQFVHPAPCRSVNFVDCAWPLIRLILEIDGRSWHSRVQDLVRDQERDMKAVAEGWQVLRIRSELIRRDRMGVVRDISAAIDARTAQFIV